MRPFEPLSFDCNVRASSSTWPMAWRNGLTVGAVASISGSSMNASLGAGHVGCFAYGGNASNGHGLYNIAGGGHSDGTENAAYYCDLLQDAPTWATLFAGSPAGVRTPDVPYYADGRPASRHLWYSQHYCAPRNRVMICMCYGLAPTGGSGGSKFDGFNLSTNDYDAELTYPLVPGPNQTSSVRSFCSNLATGDIYTAHFRYGGGTYHGDVLRWNQSTNTWAAIVSAPNANSAFSCDHGSCLDLARNRLVTFPIPTYGLGTTGQILLLSLADGSLTYGTYSGAYDNPGDALISENAIAHDTDNDLYHVLMYGGDWYTVDPTSFVVTKIATTTPGQSGGIFGRFHYMDELGGIVYTPAYGTDTKFMPTRANP